MLLRIGVDSTSKALRDRLAIFLFVAAFAASSASAWSVGGHQSTARAAVRILPTEVPEFFRKGESAISHSAIDPDVMKHRQLPQLHNRESPEHYLDWEMVGTQAFPATRYDFLTRIHQLGQEPASTGFLPYAIVESYQELRLAFAEYRRWPDNPNIQSKALVIAGHLAHYAGDLGQPLHTTIHHDGRTTLGTNSPYTGIHFAVDRLFETVAIAHLAIGSRPTPIDSNNLLAAVQRQFEESFRLVDRVYELEPDLRAVHDGSDPSPGLIAFARERQQSSVGFIAGLFRAAWVDSESLDLPPWLKRENDS